MAANELTYFTAVGHYFDVELADPSGHTNDPSLQYISAFIDFIPRVPRGFSYRTTNLDLGADGSGNTTVAIAPITARTISGQLCTINADDTPGVRLLAAMPDLLSALSEFDVSQLIYDVRFRNVTYAGALRFLNNFSFVAPASDVSFDLSSPATQLDEYKGP